MSRRYVNPLAAWLEVGEASVAVCEDAAEKAVRIYVDRPHVVNRRLAGIEEVITFQGWDELSEYVAGGADDEWLERLQEYLKIVGITEPSSPDAPVNFVIAVRELIPRSGEYFGTFEAVVFDKQFREATFLPLGKLPAQNPVPYHADSATSGDHADSATSGDHANSATSSDHVDSATSSDHVDLATSGDHADSATSGDHVDSATSSFRNPAANCTYRISWKSDRSSNQTAIKVAALSGSINTNQDISSSIEDGATEWLRQKLLPKLASWAAKPLVVADSGPVQKPSLGLVSVKRYTEVLLRLKAKYGRSLIDNWTESTDPQKFVSEDLCIAAYLLTLWGVDKPNPGLVMPSFVDLGCGNGLLVYILAGEGCPGYGVDVRERKIWKQFKPVAELQERTIDPSTEVFAGVSWVIGNHSDELTPWLPYIASVTSYSCNFFLLPCCAFDFNHKFIKPGNESEYQSYFKYIRTICTVFGFAVEEDTLRIPSTKRSCFVGRRRTYPESEQALRAAAAKSFVESRSRHGGTSFVVRPSGAEPVKNCTALPAALKESVIRQLTATLLQDGPLIDVPRGRWNAGRKLSIAELVNALDADTLTALKSQCGGLQTFIRNHKYIFDVQDAAVQLRNYTLPRPGRSGRPGKKSNVPVNLKSKSCWFHRFHPDGCPVDGATCDYTHSPTPS